MAINSSRRVKIEESAAQMPSFIPPCLATLQTEIPMHAEWLHEIKFDGYRMQPHVNDGEVTIYSRNGLDWTKRVRFLARALLDLPAKQLILDCELVSAAAKNGAADFSQLQADLSAGRHDRLALYAFDCLFMNGEDLRDRTLLVRKRMLEKLLIKANSRFILYSEHFPGARGEELYTKACAMGLEGIVSKKSRSLYRSGHGKSWLKIKCVKWEEFFIIGFVPQRRDTIAALRLAKEVDGQWIYVGKVGTGFTNAVSENLRRSLDKLKAINPPMRLPRKPGTVWVTPKLRASVAYSGMTDDGKLRHPSFKGLTKE